ncbi:MAG: methyltransferase domain-containing protein [Calditrichaeota bacterium]|nr:MAG: methyltransferase domain-containing protein [Calditrichota bacterium]
MGPRKFPSMRFVGDRHRYLLNLVKGKEVLHVGCAQFADQINRNLHVKVTEVAKYALGIDIDHQGIECLKRLGQEVRVCNALNMAEEIDDKFDVVLIPEVLEHIGCPLCVLKQARKLIKKGGMVIVSGPNSFSLRRWIWAIVGREAESEDHRFTFHPSGLMLLCQDAGLNNVVRLYSALESSHFSSVRHRLSNLLLRPIFQFFPHFSDSIIVVAVDDI